MKRLPEHGSCFVCGAENPKGIGLRWYADDEGVIHADVTLTLAEQGPPGYAHGGASAAILDEAMGSAVWNAGYQVLAVNLNINYRRPLPLNTPVKITARVVEENGRKVSTRSELRLPNGEIAVEGTGLYVEANHIFADSSVVFTTNFGQAQPENPKVI
ncbi:MAG TPA: PaaI family thioesterase [Chloroflexi bacterium]|nr:PaaI family thioesterase [Chloroflexota bacterium]